MARFTFVFNKPIHDPRRRVHLRFRDQTESFEADSDSLAVARARRILQATKIQFDGGYCIGKPITLLRHDNRGKLKTVSSASPK